ncbi:MAG: hypothetical protein K0S01_3307 [Herbinix sp.]|jgi:hypothetical protein|nr:hypothetical protein [Herbinix sp.]
MNGKVTHKNSIRDRMSSAESILCNNMREVHPGAGSVKQSLSRAR